MGKLKRATKWVCAHCKRKGVPRPESYAYGRSCPWCNHNVCVEVPTHGKVKWAKKTLVACGHCKGKGHVKPEWGWRLIKCPACNGSRKVLK